ncbi:hypothetical protein TUM3794_20790 [Shewanella colwelliana]|uniref:Polymerase beta nucleotidyltransferase domain-containing protein n=1 Tax=Shewanella colwelliana TaxID=23 RepID=A0ABQ4P0R7_SHECO|nr:hypothetical protein [Shewanella colwelliana]GIU41100.1 hypothetical protein TUM3794_20790 [Shewanella colwelliana]
MKEFDELQNSLMIVEGIASHIQKEFFSLSNICSSSFYVFLRQRGLTFASFLALHTDLSDLLTLDISHDIDLVIRVRNSIMFIDHCLLDVIEFEGEVLEVG